MFISFCAVSDSKEVLCKNKPSKISFSKDEYV